MKHLCKGSYKECVAALRSFGIPAQRILQPTTPKECTPYFSDGRISSNRPPRVVTTPCKTHILLGRGRGSHQHDGNIWFRKLIKERQGAYEAASVSGKTQMAHDVVELVRKNSGLFLKKKKEGAHGWVEVSDSIARRKVSHAFRALRETSTLKKTKGKLGRR